MHLLSTKLATATAVAVLVIGCAQPSANRVQPSARSGEQVAPIARNSSPTIVQATAPAASKSEFTPEEEAAADVLFALMMSNLNAGKAPEQQVSDFGMADRDGSGSLSREEFASTLTRLQLKPSGMDRAMRLKDKNKNGVISLEEYKAEPLQCDGKGPCKMASP